MTPFAALPKTMSRVWVSVEPRGFWAVQRYMEPLSSAGTLSNTSSLPSCSALPSRSRLPTRVQVKRGSGKTSFCREMGVRSEQTLLYAWSKDGVQLKCNPRPPSQPHKVLVWMQSCPLAWHCPHGNGDGWMDGDADLEALHQDPHGVSDTGSRWGHGNLWALWSNCKKRGQEGTSAEHKIPSAGGCPWLGLTMV